MLNEKNNTVIKKDTKELNMVSFMVEAPINKKTSKVKYSILNGNQNSKKSAVKTICIRISSVIG